MRTLNLSRPTPNILKADQRKRVLSYYALSGNDLGSSKIDDHFRDELIAAVDEAIKDLFGVGVMNALYSHLAAKGVSRRDIPNRLPDVCSILEGTFGLAGLTIQRAIAVRFYQRLGLTFELTNPGTLTEYVKEAERRVKVR